MWEKITFLDFSKICRLCLSREELDNFFKTPSLISICNVITRLKIQEDDILPKHACKECLKKIEDISNFIEMCKANHNTLSAIALHEEDKIRTQAMLDNIFVNYNKSEINDVENENRLEVEITESGAENDDAFSSNDSVKAIEKDNIPVRLNKKKLLTCKYCGRNCASKNQLEIHLRTHAGLKPYKCDKCPRRFAAKYALQRHKVIHTSLRPHKCNTCEWSGRTQLELQKHELKHSTDINKYKISEVKTGTLSNERKWKCLDCGKLFTRKFDLQLHLRIHSGFKPYQCVLCDKNFTQKHTLMRHISSVHVENYEDKYTFQCYICDKKFVRKDNLEAHMMNVHIKKQATAIFDSKSKNCTLCNKNFSQYAYLSQHMEVVHENGTEKKKSSRIRPKIRNVRFATTSNLCPFCGISFEKRKSFHAHMSRKHSNKEKKPKLDNGKPKQRKEHQCWHCGKIFHSVCNLKTHIRTHTGEKPYECKFCHLRFAAWNSWHEHENIHTGAKPYQCEFCKKGFRHRSGLRKHMKSSIHRK